jgi:hypothetical protein
MSEKIYACLLRLFPSQFREAYGEAALQLFRDRERDEKGFVPRLRLWLDLIVDLAISIPLEYSYVHPAMIGGSAQCLNSVPSFFVLENGSVPARALLLGAMLTLAALGIFSNLLNHAGGHTEGTVVASRQMVANSGSSQQPTLQPKPQAGTTAINRSVAENTALDAAERQRVIDAVTKNLKAHYVDPDVAQKMADALLAYEKNDDDAAVKDGGAFANLLTKQIRDVSQDKHLELTYSQDPLPASRFDAQGRPLGLMPDDHARYRTTMEQENCTFEKTEILANNIGYLKLNSFPDPSICRPTAVAAMAYLNHVDAIIFDLRNNRGGEPEMVALMAAYLFDRPEYWYNPRENTTPHSWTQSPVPGNRLADKPVYVLTSTRTFSGAEQFSYDLKMLKRAILVGETTGGAAHSGVFYRIDDHFGIGIPETKPINLFSKTDWAETGVEPDVKVKAADALKVAVKLAESKLQSK